MPSSLPAWGVRVEMLKKMFAVYGAPSLPAWGVRVEIYERLNRYYKNYVTPRMGSAG